MLTGPRCQVIAVHTSPTIFRDNLPTRSSRRGKIASLAGRSKGSPAESLVLLSFQVQ